MSAQFSVPLKALKQYALHNDHICLTCANNAKISVLASMYENKYHSNTTSAIDEVRLRHLTVDEALLKLEQYLNDAFMTGLYQVKVIHGKGTGTLRRVVQEHLAKHPLVESYRPGNYGEGGNGITIVELADK